MNEPGATNSSASPAKKHLILLVEDETDIWELLRPGLTKDPLSCIEVATVAEALEALRQNRIDLMVLDWQLDRSGAEVLREAKEKYPGMPVIVMSGKPFDVRTDALLDKADAFLEKPLSAQLLNSQVMQLLSRVSDASAIILPKRSEDILPLEEVKRVYIRHVLGLLGNNISKAAEALGVHRQTVSAAIRAVSSSEPDSCVAPDSAESRDPQHTDGARGFNG